MASHFHPLTVADVRHETDDCVSIRFAVPEPLRDAFRFQHGQYLTLRTVIDGEDVRRSYSICAGVPDGELRVAVKSVPGGRFSTWANQALKPGDVIEVMQPTGRFTTPIEPDRAKTYVLFAAGSGITPVISIVRTVLALEPQATVTLFYGNRKGSGIIFREEVEDLKNRFMGRFRVFHVLSRDVQQVELLRGRLDRAKVDTLLDALVQVDAVDHFFVCGPEGMTTDVRAALDARGVPSERVHFELFGVPGQSRPANRNEAAAVATGETSAVTVTLDGLSTRFTMDRGLSLLDAGREAGLDLPYACKGGVCATCRCKVVEGEVEMAVNYGLEPSEVTAGYVLSCQSQPKTETVVVDFDG